MAIWKKSKMITLYYNEKSADDDKCTVRINDKNIVVSYNEEGEPLAVVYKGTEHGQGHYKLSREDGRGQASLHQFKNSLFLDGWWEEEGEEGIEKGMWRIELKE